MNVCAAADTGSAACRRARHYGRQGEPYRVRHATTRYEPRTIFESIQPAGRLQRHLPRVPSSRSLIRTTTRISRVTWRPTAPLTVSRNCHVLCRDRFFESRLFQKSESDRRDHSASIPGRGWALRSHSTSRWRTRSVRTAVFCSSKRILRLTRISRQQRMKPSAPVRPSSDSYGGSEFSGETILRQWFNHPGLPSSRRREDSAMVSNIQRRRAM